MLSKTSRHRRKSATGSHWRKAETQAQAAWEAADGTAVRVAGKEPSEVARAISVLLLDLGVVAGVGSRL